MPRSSTSPKICCCATCQNAGSSPSWPSRGAPRSERSTPEPPGGSRPTSTSPSPPWTTTLPRSSSCLSVRSTTLALVRSPTASMSSPVSTLDWKILSEALLGGLPAGVLDGADDGPGVLPRPGPGNGGGELGVGLVHRGVGGGDPVQDVERRLGRQPVGGNAFA